MIDGKLFKKLYEMDITKHIEVLDKPGFSPKYLSWSSAVLLAKEFVEGYNHRFLYTDMGSPVFYDADVDGFFVKTEVTTDNGETWTPCTLPVLDSKFKPQGRGVRKYTKKGYKGKPDEIKTIEPANSFDVNYSQMRCLSKNIAIATGIGLSLFFKEGKRIEIEREARQKAMEEERKAKDNEEKTAKAELIETIKAHELFTDKKVLEFIKTKKKYEFKALTRKTMKELERGLTLLNNVLELKAKKSKEVTDEKDS